MENSFNTHQERPSATGSFVRGALSGAGTGALMSVIVAGVLAAGTLFTGGFAAFGMAAFLTPLMSTAAVMIPATALFSGLMGAKNSFSSKPSTTNIVPVPVAGTTAPVIYQSQEPSLDSPQAPAKSWVAATGHGVESQNRIQQILDQGMADKDRAQAILAAREAASVEPTQGRA